MKVGDDFADEYPDGDPVAAEVLATLVRTGHAIDAEIDRTMVASHGWPQTILNCLAVIEGAETKLTPSQIGERTLTSSATMTNTLDTLEHLGWARRVANPDDRRSVLVEITSEGQAVTDRFLPGIRTLELAALGELTNTELATLLKLLGKVLKGMADDRGGRADRARGPAQPTRSRPLILQWRVRGFSSTGWNDASRTQWRARSVSGGRSW